MLCCVILYHIILQYINYVTLGARLDDQVADGARPRVNSIVAIDVDAIDVATPGSRSLAAGILREISDQLHLPELRGGLVPLRATGTLSGKRFGGPSLQAFLERYSMSRFASPLRRHFGVAEMGDLLLLSDDDLYSIGMKVVQIRRVRSETGTVNPVSHSVPPPVVLGSEYYMASPWNTWDTMTPMSPSRLGPNDPTTVASGSTTCMQMLDDVPSPDIWRPRWDMGIYWNAWDMTSTSPSQLATSPYQPSTSPSLRNANRRDGICL